MSYQPQGWYGIDLDGTLAYYGHYIGPTHIGPPIPAMAARLEAWLKEGRAVRIFTARVASTSPYADKSRQAIAAWLLANFGVILPITAEKDYAMIELWDNRCVQVEPNTGKPLDPSRA
jgi:hypothetical protein